MRINKTLWFLPVLALVVLGAVLPGSKIKDYPHATNLNDTDWFVVSQSDVTRSINGGLLRTNLSTNAYVSAVTTSNALLSVINSTSNTLFTTAGTNISGILASNNVRVAAGSGVTVVTTASGGLRIYTVASTASGVTEIQTNGVRVGLVTNINFTAGVTGSVSASTAILGVSGSGSASLTGTTNFLQLSVQAAKTPSSNPVGFENGYQDWETIYYKTNDAGSIASLSGSWQFIVPNDYATNTLKVRVYSTLLTTNGPNTSNTIFRASILRATPGDTTDLHVGSFGSTVSGTNTWTASGTGTNKMQSVVITMSTTALIGPGDLAILKLDRDAANDTFGGSTALVGLQLEYTRP